MGNEIKMRKKSAYQMNPTDITVNPDENPRKDYGTDDFEALKESIRENGIQYPISVSEVREDGKIVQVNLTHGFRRMKAVQALLDEGVEIDSVPVFKAEGDRVSVLVDHMVLNGGKELTALEKASVVAELRAEGLTYEEIGQRTGLKTQMAYNYGTFIAKASAKVRKAVESGVITITTASDIVRKSESKSEQDAALDKGVSKAQASGRTKVRNTDVPTAKASISKKQFLELVRDCESSDDIVQAVLEQCNWTPLETEAPEEAEA